jgi:pantothenate kinase type III
MAHVQMGYVDGYLLCIEDTFKDLKEILTKHPVPTKAEELAHLLRARLAQSRMESQRTMRALKRMAT